MENLLLDFYNYMYVINGLQYLYQDLGKFIFILIIPIYKIRTIYTYTWWKLILLHTLNFTSFVLAFNNEILNLTIKKFLHKLNIEYISIEPDYITILVIIYLYTTISIIFMYINALTYERYELTHNIKTIWKLISKIFKWQFNLGTALFKIFVKQKNTTPIPSNITSNQTPKNAKIVSQTIKPQVILKPKKKTIKKQKQVNNDNLPKVYTDKGYAYSLQKQIAFGGEGKIHIISSSLLAKIFHNDMATEEKKEKIIKLSKLKKISSVVFPQRLLYNSNKVFIGYTMNQIYDTKELGILHIPANRKKYFPHWTYIDLLDLSITIANTLKRLHEQRVIVADFNPRNILVKESKKVYFIDIDSYQINRQPSTVGMKMYTRPMHFEKAHKQYLKNQSDDIYALSVIIFQNLTSGSNPYAVKGESNEEELIKRHEFAFNVEEPHKSNVNNDLIDAWSNLSNSLRKYFEQIFKYQNPVSLSTLTKELQAHKRNLCRVQTKTRRK